MDVCDKVTTEDSGAKDAVASMIKRLAHRNANVQLYTLEVRCTPRTLGPGALLTSLVVGKCAQSKLWTKDAPRACLEILHGRPSTFSQRPKYTSAGQS